MTPGGHEKQIGVLAILGASLMWSIEPILAKLSYPDSGALQTAVTQPIVVVQTSAVRAFMAALVALLYVLLTNRGNLKIARREVPALVYVALAGTVFADLVYFYALYVEVPVINAVVIGHMQPIFIVLFGYLYLKSDRLTRFDYLGILIMIISGLLVSTRTAANLTSLRFGTLGDLYVLAATVAWATTGIVARRYLTHLNAGVVTLYRYVVASTVFLLYLLSTGSAFVPSVYQILVGVAVGAGTILYYESLKRLKAALVGALELSTPFFAALLALLVLGERITLMQIAGIALLAAGVHFVSRREPPGSEPGFDPPGQSK